MLHGISAIWNLIWASLRIFQNSYEVLPPILHSLNTKATYLKFDMLQRHKYIYPTHLCDNITWYQCQYTSSLLTLSLTELFLAGLISTLQWQDHCDSNGTSLICPEIHQRWFRQKNLFLLLINFGSTVEYLTMHTVGSPATISQIVCILR